MSKVEYYIWVKLPNGESRHGLKPVTFWRGLKLIDKYKERNPANIYWIEPAPEPLPEIIFQSS